MEGQPDLDYELGLGEFGYYSDTTDEEKSDSKKVWVVLDIST